MTNKGLRLLVFNYKDNNLLATITNVMTNIIPPAEDSHRIIDTQLDPYRIPLSEDKFEENFDTRDPSVMTMSKIYHLRRIRT